MLHFVVRSLILFVCGQILLTQAAAQSRAPQTKLQDGFPGESWQRIASLERAGWSREKLAIAHSYANADSIHTSAVMVVQGGEVVLEWGDIDKKIDAYSVRKSSAQCVLWHLRRRGRH